MQSQCALDCRPHDLTASISPSIWSPSDTHRGAELEPIEYDGTRLGHQALGCCNSVVEIPDRRLDQQGIVVGRANFDSCLGNKTACEPEHLGTIGLHREIAQRPRIGIASDSQTPAEDGTLLSVKQGVGLDRFEPRPEIPKVGVVSADQIGCICDWSGDLPSEALGADAE